MDIPAHDSARIVDALPFFESVAAGERPIIGRRVAVYGGGNTAMDTARVARRLGAEETVIVYRRTRSLMPAHADEASDAEREGIRINWLRTITEIDGPTVSVEVMELDSDGVPQPTGRFEHLEADTVILAVGQDTDTRFLRGVPGIEFQRDGTVSVNESLETGCTGVFARWRHGAERAHRHSRGRPRKTGGAPHRRLAEGCERSRAAKTRDCNV